MHVGYGKNCVVDTVDAEQRRARFVEKPLLEQRKLRRVLDPFLTGRAAERARQSLGQFEWILATLGFDNPVFLESEVRRPALIDRRAQTIRMGVRHFGRPISARAAAMNGNSI